MIHPLHKAALDADDAFHAAVVAQFGAKAAGDARYHTLSHNEATRAAWAAKIAADEAWLTYLCAPRSGAQS